ncbi:hypothetical protein Tco_0738180 [Tanacetum coccineum]
MAGLETVESITGSGSSSSDFSRKELIGDGNFHIEVLQRRQGDTSSSESISLTVRPSSATVTKFQQNQGFCYAGVRLQKDELLGKPVFHLTDNFSGEIPLVLSTLATYRGITKRLLIRQWSGEPSFCGTCLSSRELLDVNGGMVEEAVKAMEEVGVLQMVHCYLE